LHDRRRLASLKRAVLLSIDDDLDEIRALLQTLEVVVDKVIIQKREGPHRKTYLGPGKVEEVRQDTELSDTDYIVVNGDLKPSQHHALEMLFQKECIDRVGVILRIFANNAHTKEAKNQVTLATLRYELPFLREWIHKAKKGERPGFLSGGAYATEVYYEHARSQIKRIECDLNIHSKQREVRRALRRRRGYFLVSLAGYTNAGKSALLNALSGSRTTVDNRLFSTLSTTTRRLNESKRNILLTDTVGFISKLPPNLVNAFNSTLEEIFLADLILVVIDVSEPFDMVREKLRITLNILVPRLCAKKMLIVGNKIDKIPPASCRELQQSIKVIHPNSDVFLVSATDHIGLAGLISAIEVSEGRSCILVATLPMTDSALSLISALHDSTDIEETKTNDDVKLVLRCRMNEVQKLTGRIEAIGGVVVTTNEAPPGDGTACEDRP
jgi:GTP-binding protein HflX